MHESGLDNSSQIYGHSKFSKMAARFGPTGSRSIRSAVPENSTLGSNAKLIGRPVPEIWLFEIFQDGGQPPSWIWCNRKWRHSIRRPRKPYTKTKHEVNRMTRCRDISKMRGRSVSGSVGRWSSIYTLFSYTPLRYIRNLAREE